MWVEKYFENTARLELFYFLKSNLGILRNSSVE